MILLLYICKCKSNHVVALSNIINTNNFKFSIMTETKHLSKYAAKKAALAAANSKKEVETTVDADENASVETTPVPRKRKGILPDNVKNYPAHIVNVALIIKNNAEIRRFTAIGILNYLLQKGEINGDHRYVTFKWNKFAVKCNGLMREYSYSEPFFLNALVASFSSFSASAQRIIDTFCHKEMSVSINKAVDKDEVATISELNEEYIDRLEKDDDDSNDDTAAEETVE